MPQQSKKKKKASGKKMQDVSFRYVEEFLDYLPEEERKIVDLLRKIVFSVMPDCTETLSFNVPFYKIHSYICFIWPPAVTWEGVKQQAVRFGFTKGYLLQDEIGYLDRGKRKQIYCIDFHTIKDIDPDLLKAYLYEAVLIDEEIARQKKKKK